VIEVDQIEPLVTRLVQTAPILEPRIVDELIVALRGVGSPLALSIARIAELVADQLVDAGIALPALAMACATLVDGVHGRLGERELEAARYEIETLTPMPDRPDARPRVTEPDVPVSALSRGPRPRT